MNFDAIPPLYKTADVVPMAAAAPPAKLIRAWAVPRDLAAHGRCEDLVERRVAQDAQAAVAKSDFHRRQNFRHHVGFVLLGTSFGEINAELSYRRTASAKNATLTPSVFSRCMRSFE